MSKLFAGLAALALVAGLLAGCGDDGSDGDQASSRGETLESLPPLPSGWYEQVNERGGFAFGLPPGWSAQGRGPASLALSPDGQVAVSISADRTGEALETSLPALARGVARSLSGFEDVTAGKPKPLAGHYPGVLVEARGRGGEKGDQDLEIVVMRRGQLAVFILLVARRSSVAANAHAAEVSRLVASLRGRPAAVPG